MNQSILAVPLYSVKLVRDALQQNMITVPKHEMPLLRKAHNNGALDDLNDEGEFICPQVSEYRMDSILSEQERLMRKYGGLYGLVYTDISQLAEAIQKEKIAAPVADAAISDAPDTVEELKAAITAMGGTFGARDSKAKLTAQYHAMLDATDTPTEPQEQGDSGTLEQTEE